MDVVELLPVTQGIALCELCFTILPYFTPKMGGFNMISPYLSTSQKRDEELRLTNLFLGRLKHQSGDGTDTLFKANVVAGGILALTEVDGKDPDILLRAGSGQKRMLTIMEGNGSYFGKIEIADSRGMVLYHMQKPCATITADVKDLSMQVYPLSADAKFLRAASMIKKGERLRIQVSKNFDASLLLGCLLGIVILEPDLMKRACHH